MDSLCNKWVLSTTNQKVVSSGYYYGIISDVLQNKYLYLSS